MDICPGTIQGGIILLIKRIFQYSRHSTRLWPVKHCKAPLVKLDKHLHPLHQTLLNSTILPVSRLSSLYCYSATKQHVHVHSKLLGKIVFWSFLNQYFVLNSEYGKVITLIIEIGTNILCCVHCKLQAYFATTLISSFPSNFVKQIFLLE